MGEVINIGTALAKAATVATTPSAPKTMLQPYRPAQLPAQLPPSVQEAALMLTNPEQRPARAMLTDDLIKDLFEPLAIVPMLLGHSKSLLKGEDLFVLASAVAEMVQRHFPAFRIGEIGLALRRGCSGEWQKPGELLLPSLPCIRSWLQAYQDGSRATAIKALQAAHLQQQQRSLPTPVIDYPKEAALLAEWVTEHATPEHPAGQFPEPLDQGNVLFKWLKQVGAFRQFKTLEQYERMHRKECLARAQRPPAGLEEYRHGRTFWGLLYAGKWHADHPFADSVTNACCKRLLREWIYYHLGRGTDLRTWLTELAAAVHPQSKAA